MARAVNVSGYRMVQRVMMVPTLLQVLGIAAIATALCVMFPSPPPGVRRRAVVAFEVVLGIAVLVGILNTG